MDICAECGGQKFVAQQNKDGHEELFCKSCRAPKKIAAEKGKHENRRIIDAKATEKKTIE